MASCVVTQLYTSNLRSPVSDPQRVHHSPHLSQYAQYLPERAAMKLKIPNLPVALFCNLSNAAGGLLGYDDVVFADVPSHMQVGQQVRIAWPTPRDYVRTSKLHTYRSS